MLFNSFEFIFVFLPITFVLHRCLLKRLGETGALYVLTFMSFIFYGWWDPANLPIIGVSILFNFLIGESLMRSQSATRSRLLLFAGVTFNLLLLGWYKYLGFVVHNLNLVFSTSFKVENHGLPLGISFFTFQQVAYLVDMYRRQIKNEGIVRYSFFVTFFPQLIAGPIVHYKEILPQLTRSKSPAQYLNDLSMGTMIFFVGLFKKTVIADGMAVYATPVFEAAANGNFPSASGAWIGALAYTFQLYFDFSGYSDMAIGLGRMFGFNIPINFNSPYKATNLIEFWRRWHITLSHFLRDYLYFSLGGNRKGKVRRYINLFATMAIGGAWHGAGWTFILWGTAHGLGLALNHAWQATALYARLGNPRNKFNFQFSILIRLLSWSGTFIFVVCAWVIFRADSLTVAYSILKSMFIWDPSTQLREFKVLLSSPVGVKLAVAAALCLFFPNTSEIFQFSERRDPLTNLEKRFYAMAAWRPSALWCCVYSVIAILALLNLTSLSEFLYFQF